MDKNNTLDEIFSNDPFGLLNIKPTSSPSRNEDERFVASFQEISAFYEKNNREPQQSNGVHEYQLYSRLKGIRSDPVKIAMLKEHDPFGLLDQAKKVISSLDDILNDDSFGLLNDDSEGLFDLKHVKLQDERAIADFVAKRKPCRDFSKYEPIFKEIQNELAHKKRKLIPFKQEDLKAGDFYVHNGILVLLQKVDFEKGIQKFKSGARERQDGRTKVIFENGTESNMLYRSLYKALLANGKSVSENIDKVNEKFIEKFSSVTAEDEEAGYIYVLKSQSEKREIKEIPNLYKIGVSKIEVAERIKNAMLEPTYLMAGVKIVTVYKCFNMNPQKLEQLLHNFFGKACLNIDIFDKNGGRHTPREWFIAPLDIIKQAVHLIITGEIVNYRYDADDEEIISR
jgi:hypothetical protein